MCKCYKPCSMLEYPLMWRTPVRLATHYYTGHAPTLLLKLWGCCVVWRWHNITNSIPIISSLDRGLSVDSINARGETPLHDAVVAKSWNVVQELLRLGANKEISATSGWVMYCYCVQSLWVTAALWRVRHLRIYWRVIIGMVRHLIMNQVWGEAIVVHSVQLLL